MLTDEQKLQIIADNTTCSEAGDEDGYSVLYEKDALALFNAVEAAVNADRVKPATPTAEIMRKGPGWGVKWLRHPRDLEGEKLFLHPPLETHPTLKVWFGPMPESNGKANWTATLYRDTGDKWDFSKGHVLYQGEHKERARYSADCIRFMIGELDKDPNPLDYADDVVADIQPVPTGEVAHWGSVGLYTMSRFYNLHGYQLDPDTPLYVAPPQNVIQAAIEKDRRERKAIPEYFVPWLMSCKTDGYSCEVLVKEAIERLHYAFKDPKNDPMELARIAMEKKVVYPGTPDPKVIVAGLPQNNYPIQGFFVDNFPPEEDDAP
jgi:hypothetical protein